MRDLACVIHLHSVHSDGTGTVGEIAAATRRSGADVVLLTDHDSLAARRHGEDGWRDGVLVIAGHEVSPWRENHFLAFGLDEEIDHEGLDAHGILDAVHAAGGFGFAAHPWSAGNPRFRRAGFGMPFGALDAIDGVELWSLVTDSVETLRSPADLARFVATPDRWLTHPPRGHVAAWDALCAVRPVAAIGGLDAHQVGVRVRGRVVRLMGYQRSFRLLRTHVLLEGDGPPTEAAVLGALRAGRCYLARDSLHPASGFSFDAPGVARMGEQAAFADGTALCVRSPRPAALTLLRDGEPVAATWGERLLHHAERPGVYRAEALLPHAGRIRTWVMTNPVYLR